ncbi:hypothetical protein BpHYR1_029843 [Brachionus plicatilis]|uniref:Uncharacterized protein n=1 Tax=Brachionus plicatilis TaxID=10195 RepID=A0A3M7PZZ6_BRAPC|nr:hypothetical protein BpHYR1_029843 [Brachionus plicatilis]
MDRLKEDLLKLVSKNTVILREEKLCMKFYNTVDNHERVKQAQNKQYVENVERAIVERIEGLTYSDIKNEAKWLWEKNGTNKQRVSKIDRESGNKIGTEEENQRKNLDFFGQIFNTRGKKKRTIKRHLNAFFYVLFEQNCSQPHSPNLFIAVFKPFLKLINIDDEIILTEFSGINEHD